MSIIKCKIKDCESTNLDNVILFRFPKNDRDAFESWCRNADMNPDSKNSRSRICSRHFEKHFVGSKRLKKGAVPTLLLGKPDDSIIQPKPSCSTLKIRKCRVPTCTVTSPPSIVFLFPEKKRSEWEEICGITADDRKLKEIHICAKHFEVDMVYTRTLARSARPTLHLPPKIANEDSVPMAMEAAFGSEDGLSTSDEMEDGLSTSDEMERTCQNCEKFYKLQSFYKLKCEKLEKGKQDFISQLEDLKNEIEVLKREVGPTWHRTIEIPEPASEEAVEYSKTIVGGRSVKDTKTQKTVVQTTGASKKQQSSIKRSPKTERLDKFRPIFLKLPVRTKDPSPANIT